MEKENNKNCKNSHGGTPLLDLSERQDASVFRSQSIQQQQLEGSLLFTPTDESLKRGNLSETRTDHRLVTVVDKVNDESHDEDDASFSLTHRWHWTIPWTSVPIVPEFCPIECHSLHCDMSLKVVTSRISDFCRINSYTTSYRKARVYCVTPTFLKFVIQIWKKHPHDSLVVEVQRRKGSTVELLRMRKRLFHAILTGEQLLETSTRRPIIPRSDMLQQQQSYAQQALHNSLYMLKSIRVDQNRLGLESLRHLTSSMVNSDIRNWTSQAIVFGESGYGRRLQEALFSYFPRTTYHADYLQDEDEDDDEDDDSIQECTTASEFKILALQVVTNSLQAIYLDNPAKLESVNLSSQLWSNFLTCLVQYMENCPHCPQESVLSAKCLRHLTFGRQSIEVNCNVDFLDVLDKAHKYGVDCNKCLETEMQKLINLFV